MTMFTQIIKLTSKEIKTIKQYLKPNHATITWFFFIQKKPRKFGAFLLRLTGLRHSDLSSLAYTGSGIAR